MPKSGVWAGESIDRFIPPQLRNTFYKGYPYKYARNDGIGGYDFPTNGLVLYLPLWALNNGGTNSIQSIDAFKHTGTITGALWGLQGRTFDIVDDNIDCGNNAIFNLTGSFSIEAWIKTNTATPLTDRAGIVTKMDASLTKCEYALELTTNGYATIQILQANGNGYGSVTGSVDLTDNIWHHLCGVFTSATLLELYVDGVSVGTSSTFTGTRGSSTASLRIGIPNYTTWKYFGGTIGEVRLYNPKALTIGEVNQNRLATIWRY
jgi:hypothetical protein